MCNQSNCNATTDENSVEKHYYREMLTGAEFFRKGDIFVVKANLGSDLDLFKANKVNLLKNPGIYTIFNDEIFYTGQTSRPVIVRLKEHYKTIKKADLFESGKIFIFGDIQGRLGKDKLDHLEKEVLNTLCDRNRLPKNDKPGAVNSYICESHLTSANKMLEEVISIASLTNDNPFLDFDNSEIKKQFLDLMKLPGAKAIYEAIQSKDFLERMSAVTNSSNFNAILFSAEKSSRKEKSVVIEYNWPSGDPNEIRKPKETSDRELQFYLESRDGPWPKNLALLEDFENDLTGDYQWRRDTPHGRRSDPNKALPR